MAWNKREKRWFVRFGGKQITRSPKQLGIPRDQWDNQENSRAQADAWWRQHRAELEATTVVSVPTHLIVDRAIAQAHQRQSYNAFVPTKSQDPTATSLASHIEAYRLKAQRDTESGIIKAGRYVKIDNSLKWFAKFCVEKSFETIEKIDADCLDDFYGWLTAKYKKEKVLACASCRDHWQVYHVFVQWLAERRVILMPLNINAKRFRFDCPKVKYRYWDKAEFQTVYTQAHDRLKLYALLVANCGFYASDIGSLKVSEIDLKKGTITRQRTKTGDDLDLEKYEPSSNVPTTTFYLWPETLKLLKAEISTGTLALTNEDGGPLWKDGVYPTGHPKAGKYWKTNNIICVYSRFCLSHKIDDAPTFEQLRKTSAQFLSDSEYKDCADMFGGWAASTTRTKHYTEITDARFKEACLWLRGCYL